MKAELTLPPELAKEIALQVVELLKPILAGNGKDDRYMTMKELSKYIGIAYSTIANNKKYLPHTYLNGTPLFKKSEIDKLLEQTSVKPKAVKKKQKFMELFNNRR